MASRRTCPDAGVNATAWRASARDKATNAFACSCSAGLAMSLNRSFSDSVESHSRWSRRRCSSSSRIFSSRGFAPTFCTCCTLSSRFEQDTEHPCTGAFPLEQLGDLRRTLAGLRLRRLAPEGHRHEARRLHFTVSGCRSNALLRRLRSRHPSCASCRLVRHRLRRSIRRRTPRWRPQHAVPRRASRG